MSGPAIDRFDWEWIRSDIERREVSVLWGRAFKKVDGQVYEIELPLKLK